MKDYEEKSQKRTYNRLKNRQIVVQNRKNKVLYNDSVPLFEDQFLKRDFITVSAAALSAAGGKKLGCEW